MLTVNFSIFSIPSGEILRDSLVLLVDYVADRMFVTNSHAVRA
jgi:hypothetical protein